MPFGATVEVERFDEAADWFLERIVLTGEQASGLTGRAAVDSFWVGAGLELAQVQRVHAGITKAIEKGETFESFRERFRSELQSDAHAETVFRNAVQRAYNAGRWEQMTAKDVVRFRPFFLYDSILDDRTTEVCKICNGTLLPADDPWWTTHVPPLHHRCRSSIRNLRKSEAERRGIKEKGPDTAKVKPSGEWGQVPSSDNGWKPDLKKVTPTIRKEVKKKETKRKEDPVPPMKAAPPPPKSEPRQKKPKEPPEPKVQPQHTYEFWLQHYTPKYGAAAKSVAWGRASMEVGLDMKIADVEAQLARVGGALPDGAGSVADALFNARRAYRRANPRAREPKTLRGLGDSPEARTAATLAGHLSRVVQRATPLRHTGPVTNDSQANQGNLRRVLNALSVMSGRDLKQPTSFAVEFAESRARADLMGRSFRIASAARPDALRSIAHEWTHALEHNGDLAERAAQFRAARARSPKLEKLRDLTGLAYGDHEVVFAGDYVDPYIGRKYSFDNHGVEPTEVSSMSVEQWFQRYVHEKMKRDPEFLWFSLGQLSGHDLPPAKADFILDP